jgi:hypothetical protein
MSLEISTFDNSQESQWESFCESCINSTFLHSRSFLNYHGERFKDVSLFIKDSKDIIALIPLAVSPADSSVIVSHPGITFGGIIHSGKLRGPKMIEAIKLISHFLNRQGFRELIYKAPPQIYSLSPSQDDIFALHSLGAQRFRTDLSSTIDLTQPFELSERRRRGLKKASKLIDLSSDDDYLDELWEVIRENLARKHNVKPVHSLDELLQLKKKFPHQIFIRVGLVDGKVEGGMVFFGTPRVWHAQYIAASLKGYENCVLDSVTFHAIQDAQEAKIHYFDFGISNDPSKNNELNEGLFKFKSEFGSGAIVYEHYRLKLGNE